MRRILAALLMLVGFTDAFAGQPNVPKGLPKGLPCPHWPINLAEAAIKNAGSVKDIGELDESRTEATLLAINRIGTDPDYHSGLYRQVYEIAFHRKDGKVIRVVTVNDATREECSIGFTRILGVDKVLDNED